MTSSLYLTRGSIVAARIASHTQGNLLKRSSIRRTQVRMGSGGSSSKALVDDLVQKNPVMVFSKSFCPYCSKAKSVLNGLTDKYEVLEIESRDDMNEIQDYLRSITGARSVPRVFIKGQCIGGGDETAALARSGELEKLLKEVGILYWYREAQKVA